MNKTTIRYVSRSQLGFSLIELMIAMVISSIVIGGIFSIFIKTKDSQRYSMAVSRVQESSRFSLGYLKQDIRMIGYRGCISFDDPTVTVNVNDDEMPVNFNAANNELIGFEVTADSFDDPMYDNASNIKDIIKVGTDAF
ncbi:MAG: prepilin-type N-terminal cleavage/methylation domain-containing protein, partial [Gammaproteobacteria bacterium]|nr:prepilin-type N-terminal cleavage/methylation domain-containing protein [Gammaproteobacteria bacterium]